MTGIVLDNNVTGSGTKLGFQWFRKLNLNIKDRIFMWVLRNWEPKVDQNLIENTYISMSILDAKVLAGLLALYVEFGEGSREFRALKLHATEEVLRLYADSKALIDSSKLRKSQGA